jgi:hypothetical protein
MEPGQHTNPLEDALSHGSRRVAEVASLTGATAQVVLQRRALHNTRKAAGHRAAARILDEQERLIHQQARLSWAPAHDPQWLARADLPQAARAWASAASYADTDPAAASAMHKCEDRLRALHPHAMARYDRLRADGMNPLDAMHKTTPFFGHSPDAHVGDPAPTRPALAAGSADAKRDASPAADHAPGDPAEPEPGPDRDQQAELRGRQIIARLQSGARGAGRPELGADELAMVLEATTNLPGEMIDKLARQAAAEGHARNEEHRAADVERARAADLDAAIDLVATATADERTTGLTGAQRDAGIADSARAHAGTDRSAAQLAALSFPRSATDAVRAAATVRARRPAQAPARMPAPEIAKRPRQSS